MIITRTPFRVSFIGGGSDLKSYYSKSRGAVLSTTINKYMYISSHPFFNRKAFQLKYSKTELANSADEIQHPILREVLKELKIRGGLEISSNADIPAGTGLGSSSAFTVGLLQNLYTFLAKDMPKSELAEKACRIEIGRLKAPIGKQDQYASSFGGLNLIEFSSDDSVRVEPLTITVEDKIKLQKNLMMFYTKIQRSATKILKEQKYFMSDSDKFGLIDEMVPCVYLLRDALRQGRFDYLGEVLHKGWQLKKKITSKISSDEINYYYDKALKAGASGGKLLGAGGGGFLLFYCRPKKQDKLRSALRNLFELKFTFDHEGAKVIYIGKNDKENENGFFE
ncbi:MAG: GHMP kinase [Candidatus Omnitrophica bacterium]|nr:GHMP kinase [Candidatus Omnitrophota bacterium]